MSKNLRHLRQRSNLSQEELAQQIGLNRGNVASYENGTAEPKICNLIKLSHFFEVSISDITQKNLAADVSLLEANLSFRSESERPETEVIGDYIGKAEEISHVLNSIHACFCFKVNQMEDPPKHIQHLMSNYEQLFEVSQHLLQNHLTLIDYLKNR